MLSLRSKVKLANGVEIPRLGLGVYQSPPGRTTRRAVKYALSIGYRHVDTASLYGNEEDVGFSLRESGLRDEVFITTKVWNSEQGYDSTLRACEGSLRRLGFTYVDLYLIHWPVAMLSNETWFSCTEKAKSVRLV
jgi:diketogulonate reductase-like aldo/keto reductase